MSLHQTIEQDWKQAMKLASPSKNTLSGIRADIKNRWIAARVGTQTEPLIPSDELVLEVLKRAAKQRRESITEYQAGGRGDLVSKETLELSIIESYLPKQLSAEQLQALVAQAKIETESVDVKDLGKLMKAVIAKVAGQSNGKDVQAAVRAVLNG